MKLKIKKLHPEAVVPKYASVGAGCFDLHSTDDQYVDDIAHPNGIVGTGLAFQVPAGYVMLIFSRSGHGFKNGVRLANCVGVIDSDYRGEVRVKLAADMEGCLTIKAGDRIAQAMLMPIPRVEFDLVDELGETERGAGGFGSTGQGMMRESPPMHDEYYDQKLGATENARRDREWADRNTPGAGGL